MAGKIFYRERMKNKEGSRSPRFRIMAVSGADLKVYGNHFRKKELQQLADAADCELVALERERKAEKDTGDADEGKAEDAQAEE